MTTTCRSKAEEARIKLMRKEKRKMTIHEFVIGEILDLRKDKEDLEAKLKIYQGLWQAAEEVWRLIGMHKVGQHYEDKGIYFDKEQIAAIDYLDMLVQKYFGKHE